MIAAKEGCFAVVQVLRVFAHFARELGKFDRRHTRFLQCEFLVGIDAFGPNVARASFILS